ncbi:MAG: hypothetical protein ACI4SZ_10445 [Lachnospiraceae bacterium]
MADKLDIKNMNGMTQNDDKSCGLNDMNCEGNAAPKAAGLNNMNSMSHDDDKSCGLNDMNCNQ